MDALLLLLLAIAAQLAVVALVAAAAILFELAVAASQLLLALPGWSARRRAEPRRPWLRRLRRWLLFAGALVLLLLLAVQLFWFEGLVRLVLARTPQLQVAFAAAAGNLFTGRVELQAVGIRRDDPQRGRCDLLIERLSIDVALLRVLGSELPLERLELRGVRGRYERAAAPRRGRPYAIDLLQLDDVDVQVDLRAGDGEAAVALQLQQYRAGPLRSASMALDLLRPAAAAGRVAGRPFALVPAADGGVRWQVEALPVAVLAAWLGGPLAALASGTTDLQLQLAGGPAAAGQPIASEWQVALRELRAADPQGLGPVDGLFARGLAAWLQRHPQAIELQFALPLHTAGIGGDAGLEIGQQLALALVAEIGRRIGLDAGAQQRLRDAAAALRGLLPGKDR